MGAPPPKRRASRRRRFKSFAGAAFLLVAVPGVVEARPGGGAPPGSVAAVIAKGPYLQALGPTRVTIKLELAVPGPASVEVFASSDGGDAGTTADGGGDSRAPATAVARAQSTEARGFHALQVEGLRPGTAYEYRVTAGGAAAEPVRFTTAPLDGRPFRFLAYGDSRSDDKAHAAVVRAMESAPGDFLVNTGDMVSMGNEPRDWSELFSIEGRLLRDRCVFVAVGNHELARGDRAGEVAFLRYFAAAEEGHQVERLYGSFRWSNTRFFMLNAMDEWTGDERAWLRAELDRALAEPGLAHRIAVMHWGPFSSGPHGNNPALARGDVIAMMRDRRVELVIAGHDHAYERGAGQGLKYVVTGGAGAPLYPRKTNGAEAMRYESAYHFLEIGVDGERVTMTARRPSGAVLETCGFVGAGPWDCDADKPSAAPPAALPGAPAPPGAPVPSGARVGSACGCSVPGLPAPSAGGPAGALGLGLAVALVRRRRRW